jgi:hypothetical protein
LAGAGWLLFLAGTLPGRIDVPRILLYVTKVVIATGVGYGAACLIYESIIAGWDNFGLLLVGLPTAIAITILVVVIVGYVLNISDIRSLVNTVWRRKKLDDKN